MLSKPMLHAFARYCLGDQIATWLDIPRSPYDGMVKAGWPPFIRFRELGLALPLALAPEIYWLFDEFVRQGVLFFLGEGHPINITMPTGNNPHYS